MELSPRREDPLERIIELEPGRDETIENIIDLGPRRDSSLDRILDVAPRKEFSLDRIGHFGPRRDSGISRPTYSLNLDSAFKKYVPGLVRPNFMVYSYPLLYAPPKGMYNTVKLR